MFYKKKNAEYGKNKSNKITNKLKQTKIIDFL
jgi:hypothetical protein